MVGCPPRRHRWGLWPPSSFLSDMLPPGWIFFLKKTVIGVWLAFRGQLWRFRQVVPDDRPTLLSYAVPVRCASTNSHSLHRTTWQILPSSLTLSNRRHNGFDCTQLPAAPGTNESRSFPVPLWMMRSITFSSSFSVSVPAISVSSMNTLKKRNRTVTRARIEWRALSLKFK